MKSLNESLQYLIEEIVEQAIDELKADISHVQDLALYITKPGNQVYNLVLYDPKNLTQKLKNRNHHVDDPVIGMIDGKYDKQCGVYRVKFVASESKTELKYGPLMYELLMSVIYPEFLTADETFVSNFAVNVWKKMFLRGDLKKQKLEDTPPGEDDDTFENVHQCSRWKSKDPSIGYKYRIHQPINFNGLVTNHQKLIAELGSHGIEKSDIEEALLNGSLELFDRLFTGDDDFIQENQVVDEIKANVSDVSNMALLVIKSSEIIALVLYDPMYLEDLIKNKIVNSEQIVIAMLDANSLDECPGYEITASASRKKDESGIGYGPLMYEIMMSVIHPLPLTSDRHSITKQAQNVWNKMMMRTDVVKTPVTKVCLNNNFDRDSAMNYSFAIKSPINFQQLENNHRNAIKKLSQKFDIPEHKISNKLENVAGEFFSARYKKDQ